MARSHCCVLSQRTGKFVCTLVYVRVRCHSLDGRSYTLAVCRGTQRYFQRICTLCIRWLNMHQCDPGIKPTYAQRLASVAYSLGIRLIRQAGSHCCVQSTFENGHAKNISAYSQRTANVYNVRPTCHQLMPTYTNVHERTHRFPRALVIRWLNTQQC